MPARQLKRSRVHLGKGVVAFRPTWSICGPSIYIYGALLGLPISEWNGPRVRLHVQTLEAESGGAEPISATNVFLAFPPPQFLLSLVPCSVVFDSWLRSGLVPRSGAFNDLSPLIMKCGSTTVFVPGGH